jgi:hypothetical protein
VLFALLGAMSFVGKCLKQQPIIASIRWTQLRRDDDDETTQKERLVNE